jgi:hypothetical protein
LWFDVQHGQDIMLFSEFSRRALSLPNLQFCSYYGRLPGYKLARLWTADLSLVRLELYLHTDTPSQGGAKLILDNFYEECS